MKKQLARLIMVATVFFGIPAFAVTEVTDETVEKEVLQSTKPVILAFYTDWCSWCKKLDPELERLEKKFGDKIKFARINVEKTSAGQVIDRIPLVVLMKNGEPKLKIIGFNVDALEQMVREALRK